MNKLISLAVLIGCMALIIAPVSAQSATFTLTADVANVRTGHGIEYPVIGQIFQGSIFPIIAYSPTANWVQLDLGGGRNGWVFVHLGLVNGNGANTPIVTTNLGQGGGGGTPTVGTGGSVVTAPTTAQATGNLGQGGGFPAPATTSSQITGTMSIEEFNSTVGVTASANMRRGPGLSFGIVWIIPYGERAVPLGRNANGTWIYLNFDGREGWVFFELIAAPPDIDLTALPVR